MILSLQPMQVATGFDEEGMMVLDEGQRLVAMLVRLSAKNKGAPGQCCLEAGFGELEGLDHPTYAALDAAQEGIRQRLARGR